MEIYAEFINWINTIFPSLNSADSMVWCFDDYGSFTVKSLVKWEKLKVFGSGNLVVPDRIRKISHQRYLFSFGKPAIIRWPQRKTRWKGELTPWPSAYVLCAGRWQNLIIISFFSAQSCCGVAFSVAKVWHGYAQRHFPRFMKNGANWWSIQIWLCGKSFLFLWFGQSS